jgi:BA14K-like protein
MRFAFKYLLAGAAMLGLGLAAAPGASALTITPVKTSMDASAPVELARQGGVGGRGGGVVLRRNYGGGARIHSRGNYNRGIYQAGNRGRSHIAAGAPNLRRYGYNQGPAGRHRVRNYGYHSGKQYSRHGQWRHYDQNHHGHRYKYRHGHYRHYHDGYWYSWPWWLGAGIGIYYGGYYDQPYYIGTDAHAAWCLRRYRSYNPATDLYLGFDGYYHRCISPYGY